ncbi:MAG TPA: O-antigen ligase family protein [Gemmatimonadaceae bacterium]|nr:O-antigen ligase family protein [Gemmatimonadaceae bacterium]
MTAAVAAAPARRAPPVARGAAAALRIRERPDLVLLALALMHLTNAWRLPSIVHVLQPLRLGITSVVLAVVVFVLDRSPRRRLLDVPQVPVRLALALLAFMLISIPAGIYPSHSGSFVAKIAAPMVLLMLMLAASIRSTRDVEWFAFLNMLGGAGYCIFLLFVLHTRRFAQSQSLIFYDSNDVALMLVATIPSAAYFMSRGHGAAARLAALLSLGLYIVVTVLTGSRGGFLGLAVMLGYLASAYRGMSRSQRVAGAAFVVIALVTFGGARYLAKMGTILRPTQDYNWSGHSERGRMEVWKRGLGYIAQRPFFGVGVDNFSRAEGYLSAGGREAQARGLPYKWSVAHNSYLETAAQSGVGSLLAFLALVGTTFQLLGRVVRRMLALPFVSRELALAQMLTAALIGFMVSAFFISAEYFPYLYALLGLSLGLAKVVLPREVAKRRQWRRA